MQPVFLPYFGVSRLDENAVLYQTLSQFFTLQQCGDKLIDFERCCEQYAFLCDMTDSMVWLKQALMIAGRLHKSVLVLTAAPLRQPLPLAHCCPLDAHLPVVEIARCLQQWQASLFCVSHRRCCCQQLCTMASNDEHFNADISLQRAIAPALTFMAERFAQPIREEQLASLCHYSLTYFSRLFHRAMGVSCRDYLLDLRIKRACQLLLQEPTMRIGLIANACGFRDPSYFSRIFKKQMAITPQQYRRDQL